MNNPVLPQTSLFLRRSRNNFNGYSVPIPKTHKSKYSSRHSVSDVIVFSYKTVVNIYISPRICIPLIGGVMLR